MGIRRALLVAVGLIALAPAAAFAQASIEGVARDSSGAVLPGVTVEASSPALIEKVRSVVTDGTGQYQIIDLRPGTYAITFSLPGFNTFKREGIELTGAFAATINADLRVGELNETITVTGESPVVDVQNARQQTVLGAEVMNTIPTGRTQFGNAVLVPGINSTFPGRRRRQQPGRGGQLAHDSRQPRRRPARGASAACRRRTSSCPATPATSSRTWRACRR